MWKIKGEKLRDAERKKKKTEGRTEVKKRGLREVEEERIKILIPWEIREDKMERRMWKQRNEVKGSVELKEAKRIQNAKAKGNRREEKEFFDSLSGKENENNLR
jgi:hypothetical protein